jgi:hypothetical protein
MLVVLTGSVVMTGGEITASVATELVTAPTGFVTVTEYPPALEDGAGKLNEEPVAPAIEFPLKLHW